jgi:hypothetical protein
MKILKFPTEKIYADAWSIANSKLYVDDRRRFRETASSYMFHKYTEDILRVERLLTQKLDRWATEHDGSWDQYLDGHPRYDRIQQIMADAR